MWDIAINFLIGLALISAPSYFFYRIGVNAGIRRGVRQQIFREWHAAGALEKAEPVEQSSK